MYDGEFRLVRAVPVGNLGEVVTRHTEVRFEDRSVFELAARRVNVAVRITYTGRDAYGFSMTGPADVLKRLGYLFSTPKFATRFAWVDGGEGGAA